MFEALTERDGQLRSLIENSNTVFATTAERDEELKAAFRALPTFERESRITFERLTEFADETDPLITQLRPAARELSPTLEDLEDIAPDLKNLLEQLQPLIDASVKGFPAAEQTLVDLRPLLGQLDPATAQLTPAVDFIGALQARADVVLRQHGVGHAGQGSGLAAALPAHDEPVQPGEPGRLSEAAADQPAEPVPAAGRLRRADARAAGVRGPPVQRREPDPVGHERAAADRRASCRRRCRPRCRRSCPGLPIPPVTLPPIPQVPLTPEQAAGADPGPSCCSGSSSSRSAARRARAWSAPPCRKQGPFEFGGERTQYPHVNARGND